MLVAQPSTQGRAPAEVTRLLAAPDSPHVAAGHADGTIRIWNLDTGDCEVCGIYYVPCLLVLCMLGVWPRSCSACWEHRACSVQGRACVRR